MWDRNSGEIFLSVTGIWEFSAVTQEAKKVLGVGFTVQEAPTKEWAEVGVRFLLEKFVIPEQTFNHETRFSLCLEYHPTELVTQHKPG